MSTVIRAIKEHIENASNCFVFPSQIAASRWARKICSLGIVRSVAANRFLAWDRFKEEVIRTKDTRRRPASALIRKLYAEAMIRRNAETVFLKSVIPPEHAQGGRVFAPFIARILPSLFMLEKLMKNTYGVAPGLHGYTPEDEDYSLIKKDYSAFLERHNFFEPSWEEANIKESNIRYVIFFPELIEDFAEYDALLQAPQFIRITAASAAAEAAGTQNLVFYKSAREEIRSAVIELRKLHEEEGIPYEDMAVSVPELEEMEPCLLGEFARRHIPIVRRAGKKLGETGAGRFFTLVNECANSRFSFNSLKSLILNDHIPWKEREKNIALVNFGIEYNCVSGYTQDGKNVDIWEEAFKEAFNTGRELQHYYRNLKKHILALAQSENFASLRKHYFACRRDLLDMEKISADDDAILSRCIVELSSLAALEEMLNDPALLPAAPLGFFISCLGEKIYARDEQKSGVNIFAWRVAAASPFACHYVLNASQSAASVLYQPMKFLRQDKRKALGLEDSDATGAFFTLCDSGGDEGPESRTRLSRLRISASQQTFSGWAIPHSVFAQGKTVKAPSCPEDPYGLERRFWRDAEKSGEALGAAGRLKLFPLQQQSYNNWKSVFEQKANNFSFFASPVSETSTLGANRTGELLSAAIFNRDGCLSVTATRDLNVYYKCPLFWLYSRIFGASEFSREAALLDDTSLGSLYHVILQKLFARIKDEDRVFNSCRLDYYKRWVLEITRNSIKEDKAFKGPLAVPLVSPQASGMAKKISRLLDREAELFDAYAVAELERHVSFSTGDIIITGFIDRVSISPDGEPIIVDYKTSHLPDQTGMDDLDRIPLSEFQMPLYIKLYEESFGAEVQGAFFYSINDRKIKQVMGALAVGRSEAPRREEYTPFLEAAERQINVFAQKVKALDFTPGEIRIGDCIGCLYKTVCRSAYFLNSATGQKEYQCL